MKHCRNCKLSKRNINIIRSNGKFPAKILLLVDHPDLADEHMGKIYSGDAGKLFKTLLNEAFKRSNMSPTTYVITGAIQCRPTNELRGDTREPLPAELLGCKARVLKTVKAIKPELIFMSGDLVKRFYKKEFPDSVVLTSLNYLVDSGGENSPYYNTVLRVVMESIQRRSEQLKKTIHYAY